MKNLFAFLILMLTLMACSTEPVTDPGDSDGNGDGTVSCTDRENYSQFRAMPIEFDQAYETYSGRFFYTLEVAGPTTVSLRLDGMPSVGLVTFSVYTGNTNQTAIVDNFDDNDGPIPPSATFTGEIDEAGRVFVVIEYLDVNLAVNGCRTFQFMLTRG